MVPGKAAAKKGPQQQDLLTKLNEQTQSFWNKSEIIARLIKKCKQKVYTMTLKEDKLIDFLLTPAIVKNATELSWGT